MNKTHYKKVFNSPYLASSDLDGPIILTIKHVRQEPDKTKRTKDLFNTAYFVETNLPDGQKIKPMILNVGNSKIVASFTNSKYIEDWTNVPVTIFVQEGVRIGRDVTEGLRISPTKPVTELPLLTRDDPAFNNAINSYKQNGNFDLVLQHRRLSDDDMQYIVNGVASGDL